VVACLTCSHPAAPLQRSERPLFGEFKRNVDRPELAELGSLP